MSTGNVAIYLDYSDLGGFIVESCRQISDNKVTFWVVSVNHSEVDIIQTLSRKSAEKYFFKCLIKTQKPTQTSGGSFLNLPDNLQKPNKKPKKYHEYLYTQTLKTAWVGPEPVKS